MTLVIERASAIAGSGADHEAEGAERARSLQQKDEDKGKKAA